MKVVKVINNNLVKSMDENGNDILVMGCGLGFKKSIEDEIDGSLVEKIYICTDSNNSNHLVHLLEKIPLKQIQVTNEIVRYAKSSLGKKLNDSVYISMADHINFAVERASNGIVVKNALLWEIKKLYNHEFLIGKEALGMISRKLGVNLPEDEAGFIALHLVNASMDDMSVNKAAEMTKIIQHIIQIINYYFKIDLDEETLHYERFITHLKFFSQRALTGVMLNDDEQEFLNVLKKQYQKEYQCTLKIKEYMQKEYDCTLTEDELIYLAVHIKRITTI